MARYKKVKYHKLADTLMLLDEENIMISGSDGDVLIWSTTASSYYTKNRDEFDSAVSLFAGVTIGNSDSYTTINSNGDVYYGGSASYWDDMRVPVNAIRVPGSKAPSWASYGATQLLAFSDQAVSGNEEEVYFSVQMSHKYKEGTELSPHVHWIHSSSDAGQVRWNLQYQIIAIGCSAPTPIDVVTTGSWAKNQDHIHKLTGLPNIGGSETGVSTMVLCKLSRNSSNAGDTYTGNAYLIEFDIHYQIDTPGSREESYK